jgi:hypothetical protein
MSATPMFFAAPQPDALQASLHPGSTGSYLIGYVVLTIVTGLDVIALKISARPVYLRAQARSMTLATYLWRGTDPSVTTVVLSTAAGVVGGAVASIGLLGREVTGAPATDAIASAVIGLVLLATSVILLRTNRVLLAGRSAGPEQVATMRQIVSEHVGVVAVPDIFALVVGPSSVIVDGDVVFDDDLDVPEVEAIIVSAAAKLRARWPAVGFVYLNPVARHRDRRVRPTRS